MPLSRVSHTQICRLITLSVKLFKFFVKNITLGAPELFLTSERCSFYFPSTKLLLLGNFVQIPAYWIELWAICCLATLANWTFCDRSFGALAFQRRSCFSTAKPRQKARGSGFSAAIWRISPRWPRFSAAAGSGSTQPLALLDLRPVINMRDTRQHRLHS